jgi:hypothetical protein
MGKNANHTEKIASRVGDLGQHCSRTSLPTCRAEIYRYRFLFGTEAEEGTGNVEAWNCHWGSCTPEDPTRQSELGMDLADKHPPLLSISPGRAGIEVLSDTNCLCNTDC